MDPSSRFSFYFLFLAKTAWGGVWGEGEQGVWTRRSGLRVHRSPGEPLGCWDKGGPPDLCWEEDEESGGARLGGAASTPCSGVLAHPHEAFARRFLTVAEPVGRSGSRFTRVMSGVLGADRLPGRKGSREGPALPVTVPAAPSALRGVPALPVPEAACCHHEPGPSGEQRGQRGWGRQHPKTTQGPLPCWSGPEAVVPPAVPRPSRPASQEV